MEFIKIGNTFVAADTADVYNLTVTTEDVKDVYWVNFKDKNGTPHSYPIYTEEGLMEYAKSLQAAFGISIALNTLKAEARAFAASLKQN